jgi:hypothetical protein
MSDVSHEEHGHRGAFFIEREGVRVAEMTYSRTSPTLVIIDHTEVSTELGGQGVGHQLLDHAVAWARATNTRLLATCPFATVQFTKDPARFGDVLA